jgi:16S rRNA (cytidine1402-2'-O)-methyltransferase
MLFVVPTPIGNLKDMTPRALEVLKECDLVLAEDTRVSGNLLKKFDISVPLSSFHAHNEHRRLDKILEELSAGKNIALVSDAGTPGISDPGFLLVNACNTQGIKVDCLPGATAFVPALVESGFPINSFVFEGFLPKKKGRKTKILEILEEKRTTVIYESPYRIVRLLKELAEFGGPEREVSLSRELSKKFGETVGGTVGEMSDHFEKKDPKGEFVVVLKGKIS